MAQNDFKARVQNAYVKAVQNKNSWVQRSDQTYQIFDGVAVFGREAGIDLIESVIDKILQEAVKAAESKMSSLSLRPSKTGKAALIGMVETLRELTALQVAESNGVITLTWARTEPDLV